MQNNRHLRRTGFLVLIMLLILSAFALSAYAETTEDHVWDSGTLVSSANCDHPALYKYTCTICGATKQEYVGVSDPNNHNWGAWEVTQAATCSSIGRRTRTCQNNVHHTETQEIPKTDHTLGSWETTVAASCTEGGVQVQKCTVCGEVVNQRSVSATGHSWGDWVTVTAATCTKDGQQKRTCSRCNATETRTLTAAGHKWGKWTTVTAATCTKAGKEERVCSVCNEKEERSIAATGHSWGKWTVVREATCTVNGERRRVCSKCGAEEVESIAKLNHPKTHWEVLIKPTATTEGKRQLVCDICGEILKVETMGVTTFSNNTMCAFGPRLKDTDLTPYNTDKWYMFTPFDASEDGVQTYELVASNMYIVGTVTLEIKEGVITVDYKLNSSKITVDKEFFTILHQIEDITQYEPEILEAEYGMKFRQEYSLSEDFDNDPSLVLYLCCRVTYQYDAKHMSSLNYNSSAHKTLLKKMEMLMD